MADYIKNLKDSYGSLDAEGGGDSDSELDESHQLVARSKRKGNNANPMIRLKPIELPKFSGDYNEDCIQGWNDFFQMF